MSDLAIDTFPPERFGLVTGSRCTPLVPSGEAKSGMITLGKELAKEKYFRTYDEVSTWQMDHGKMAEMDAFQYYMDHYDSNIKKGEFGFDGDVGWSPDAEHETEDYGIDWKAPTTLTNFLSYLTDGISTNEYNQCQLYMMGRNKDRWLIASFLMETQKMNENGLTYPVPFNKRMILTEVKRDWYWQEKFKKNLPFVVYEREKYVEMYKLKFDKNV
jgi:hypothetical protein